MNITKGVVCRICPDDEMPVDQHGIAAQVVIAPSSPVARMNYGTLNEPAINRVSHFVQKRCAELYPTNPQAAGETLLGWFDDVHPQYGKLVRQVCSTPEKLAALTKEMIDDKIHILVPPSLRTTMDPENIIRWTEKWGAQPTPVTYSLYDRNGVKRTYTTKYPVHIGEKYIFCLSKLPYPTSAGISHVSHHGIPVKPGGNVKNQFVTRPTAIKLGEDENRVLCMDVPEEEVVRLNNYLSNSPMGMKVLVQTLLTAKHPTAIRRLPISNQDLARTSAVTAMFHHITAVLGINTRDTLTTEEPPAGLRNDSAILGSNDIRLGSGFSDGSDGALGSDEHWLATALHDAEDAGDAILDAADSELVEDSILAEMGAEDLLDLAPDPGDEGLAAGDDVVTEDEDSDV